MVENIIKLKDIDKRFAGVHALDQVSLDIKRGEIRCLAGENGCGKSTLIKIISGVYKKDGGTIKIDGKEYINIDPIEAIRKGIHVIYQDFSLYPNLSAAENIGINAQFEEKRKLVNWKEIRSTAEKALEQIGVDIDLDEKVVNLSVADKQLIEISRALWHDAKLIIMDEPTTALTRKEVDSLFSIISRMKNDGISTLFVSHKLREVMEISEKITILRNGKKVAEGDVSEFDEKKIVYHMTGREVSDERYEFENKKDDKDILEVNNLTNGNSYKDINFKMKKGEILGVTGLLGSGRTELAQALVGLKPYASGEILIDGETRKIKNIQDAIANGLGYVPEDRVTAGLFEEQPIKWNIIVSTLSKFKKKLGFVDHKGIVDAVDRWIDEMNVATPSAEVPVQSLSGGNQQKVVLAKWLATRAKVLILNGPTVGVDIGSKSDIHEKLRTLARAGLCVIIISDDMPELIQTCNRIIVMHKGEIVKNLKTFETDEEALVKCLSSLK